MSKIIIVAGCALGFSIGVALADEYPYPDDPTPGGGACALTNGCLNTEDSPTYGYDDCARCCDQHCDGMLNNCYNACWNAFCRFTNPPASSHCPVV